MKKLTAILLAVALLASMTLSVSAATTTLTTTVPDATYTMNIPADQVIPYGETSTKIGTVTITDASGFASGKNVYVKVEYDGLFKSETAISTIPYSVKKYGESDSGSDGYAALPTGSYLTFKGITDGTVRSYFEHESAATANASSYPCHSNQALVVSMKSADWGKALAGDYSTVITFTAQVANDEPAA